jgi:hypothetical protein
MSDSTKMIISSNRLYDSLKYSAQIFLPALATLYFGLSQIWGLPYGAEVVGTITAVNTFLGVLLRINSVAYNNSDERFDGVIEVYEDDTSKSFNLKLNDDPYDLDTKDEVLFRVNDIS